MVWLTDWTYRKPITLSRASGAVTNYQMKLLVGERLGSSGSTAFLVDTGGALKTNLKAYFSLAGNAVDVVNAHNGTGTDMTYGTSYGKMLEGALFNGSTSRIQCDDHADLTLGAAFTIALWVKPDALPTSGNLMSLINKYDQGTSGGKRGGYDIRLYNNGGTQQIDLIVSTTGGTTKTTSVNYSLSTVDWSFLVARVTGTKHEIWVNNTSLVSDNSTVDAGDDDKKLNIGNFGYYTPSAGELGRYFDGAMDEIGLWAKSLSTQEMTDLYNGGVGNTLVSYNVDCVAGCKTDFSDLRFTADDGTTLLDYWIESISGTTPNQVATVWIEFDSIGTGATTFYMYYGNAGASAASNGANTFIVFDDFERGADGDALGGSWSVTGTCKISTTQKYGGTRGNKLVGQASPASFCTIPVTSSADIAIRMRVYKPDASAMDARLSDGTSYPFWRWHIDEKVQYYNGTAWVDSGSAPSADAWHLFEMYNMNYTADTFSLSLDGTEILNGVAQWVINDITPNALWIDERVSTAGIDFWVDDFLVRNWRATEPAWGSWGAEEEYEPPAGGGPRSFGYVLTF